MRPPLRPFHRALITNGIYPLLPPPLVLRSIKHQTRYRLCSTSSTSQAPPSTTKPHPPLSSSSMPPLKILPTPLLLRTALLTSLMTLSPLLTISIRTLTYLLSLPPTSLLSPVRNVPLRKLLKRTIYAQFCAGETPQEVQQTVEGLKGWGVGGVMMGWAREVERRGEGGEKERLTHAGEAKEKVDEIRKAGVEDDKDVEKDMVLEWKEAALETVEVAGAGDIICLKLTGAGPLSLRYLETSLVPPPPAIIEESLHAICGLAVDRKVRVVIDAEQIHLQDTIDTWTLELQRQWNTTERGYAVVYGSYQAYLKRTPEVLSQQLKKASEEGWILGAKLVRGAYLATDPREEIWGTKEQTDRAYNGIARSLVLQESGEFLRLSAVEKGTVSPQDVDVTRGKEGEEKRARVKYPEVDLILATHNIHSAREACRLLLSSSPSDSSTSLSSSTLLIRPSSPYPRVILAQLMGMADHVSCELIQSSTISSTSYTPSAGSASSTLTYLASEAASSSPNFAVSQREQLKTYKYLVWGPLPSCLAYLARRVEENRDAVERTGESAVALRGEVRRRVGSWFKGWSRSGG